MGSTAHYTDEFVALHEQVGQNIPIGTFVNLVKPSILGLEHKQDFFKPVRFNVLLTTDRRSMCLDVPVHANENWMPDLKERLAHMLDLDPVSIELRTVTGKPLDLISKENLNQLGHLSVFVNGQCHRVETMPTKVPMEYSVHKRKSLQKWVASTVARSIPTMVASELAKLTSAPDIDMALLPDGPIHGLIEEALKTSVDNWPEFVRVHHMNSPKEANEEAANAVAYALSDKIRNIICSYVHAYSEPINTQLMIQAALRLQEKGKKTAGKSLVSAPISGKEVDKDLFKRLMEDVVAGQGLVRTAVKTIYSESPNFLLLQQREIKSPSPSGGGGAPFRIAQEASDHHPWFAQIHHTIMPLRGQYPADYMARHAHQDMSKNASYPGDVTKTYAAYHMFSGKQIMPPGLQMRNGKPLSAQQLKLAPVATHHAPSAVTAAKDFLVPVACGMRSRRDKEKEEDKDVQAALPVASELDYMVPIIQEEMAPPVIPFLSAEQQQETAPPVIPFVSAKIISAMNDFMVPVDASSSMAEDYDSDYDSLADELPDVNDIFT